MNNNLFRFLYSTTFLLIASGLMAAPGKRTQGNGGGGGPANPEAPEYIQSQAYCVQSTYSNYNDERDLYVKNENSSTLRLHRIKLTIGTSISNIYVGQVCGLGSKKFKVIAKSGNTITLKPNSGWYLDMSGNNQVFTGINLHMNSDTYHSSLWNAEYDWRYYEIQGPSSMSAYSYANFKIGGSTGSCSFNWSSRALPSGSWGSIGSGGTKGRTMTTTNFLLKVSHSCPGESGTRYKTVYLSSNKMAEVSDNFPMEFADSQVQNLSENVVISPNYPNPFNPTTRIEFELFDEQDIDLSVFDLTGRKVETLMSGVLGAGQHAATFDAAGLPNGTYLYILTHEAGRVVNRMTLMK